MALSERRPRTWSEKEVSLESQSFPSHSSSNISFAVLRYSSKDRNVQKVLRRIQNEEVSVETSVPRIITPIINRSLYYS